MIVLDVLGWRKLELAYLVLDVNGTLAVDGALIDGVAERVAALRDSLDICLLTADTHGLSAEVAQILGVRLERIQAGNEAAQKQEFVERLGAEHVVAMGNGANDAGMLRAADLGIAVMGGEGLAVAAMQNADIVVANIADGLDLLVRPNRLLATLRR
jgi:P-type E1-E2 ATPase